MNNFTFRPALSWVYLLLWEYLCGCLHMDLHIDHREPLNGIMGHRDTCFLPEANQNIKFSCAVPALMFTLQRLLLHRVSQETGCFSTLIFDEESVRWQESTSEDAYHSVHSLSDYYLCCLSFGFCLLQKELLWLYAKRP